MCTQAFTVTMTFFGGAGVYPFVVANDLVPESAGISFGFSNTLGTVPGTVLSAVLSPQCIPHNVSRVRKSTHA